MKRQKTLRLAVTVLTVLLGVSLAAAALALYFSGLRRRTEAGSGLISVYTRENVGRTLLWLSPVFVLWLCAVIAAAVLKARPQPALPSVKRLLAMDRRKPAHEKSLAVYALRMALLTAAVILAVYGIHSGGLKEVMAKAINICTECIGLG